MKKGEGGEHGKGDLELEHYTFIPLIVCPDGGKESQHFAFVSICLFAPLLSSFRMHRLGTWK